MPGTRLGTAGVAVDRAERVPRIVELAFKSGNGGSKEDQ